MVDEKITFKDLSGSLKVAICFSYFILGVWVFYFLVGLMMGILGWL